MRKKTKKKFIVASMDMLPFNFTVLFIAGDWRSAANEINKEIQVNDGNYDHKVSDRVFKLIDVSEFEYDTCTGMTMRNEKITSNLIVILMRNQNPPLKDIVHECHHATMMVLDYSGVNDTNHETSAYLIERLFNVCMNAVNNKED
jgi:hypothetical protein